MATFWFLLNTCTYVDINGSFFFSIYFWNKITRKIHFEFEKGGFTSILTGVLTPYISQQCKVLVYPLKPKFKLIDSLKFI